MVKLNQTEAELTQEEILRMLEDAAQARLGMSAREMLDRYRKGALSDIDAVADLIALANLLQDKVAA